MTREVARRVYEQLGVGPENVEHNLGLGGAAVVTMYRKAQLG